MQPGLLPMSRPPKRTPAKGFMDYDTAMALALHKGKAVRCDEYMGPGWAIRYIKSGKGFFHINPTTNSNYKFTPQAIDTHSVLWRIA